MPARGAADFDAARLRDVVAALADGARAPAAALENYRAFYRLSFADMPHEHEMYRVDVVGEHLAVQFFLPPEPAGCVLFCHGYYDHVGLFRYVIRYLLQRGFAVATFDQIGHGLSSGAPATIESFDRYVAATRRVHAFAKERLGANGPWHFFGQSMGGAIVMEYLQQHPPAEGVGEIVLFAPLVRPYAWWLNRFVFGIAKYTIESRVRTLTDNAENAEFHALQKIDPLQARTLPVAWVQAMVDWFKRFEAYPVSALAPKVLQGDADRTVDARHNLKIYRRRYPHSLHLVIPGGRHHLGNESPAIREAMWRWVDETCSFAPRVP